MPDRFVVDKVGPTVEKLFPKPGKKATSQESTRYTRMMAILHLIVQHSLSSKWAIAPMQEWIDSNRQLITVNKDKFALGNEELLNLKNTAVQILPSL